MRNSAFLIDGVRTPFGKFGGGLAQKRPDDLAAFITKTIVERNPEVDPTAIDSVVFGNANGAGEENRNVARMALLLAGLPVSIPANTVNRLCGSSLDALIIASREIETGDADLVVAGGVESMSRSPWVALKPEKPFSAQDLKLHSTTLGWRLVNPNMPKEWTVSLGEATEQLAERYGITRDRQDQFAYDSHQKTAKAWGTGFFAGLVAQVPDTTLLEDESIRAESSLEDLAGLKTVFRAASAGGTVTAGNASPLNDGASAMLVASEAQVSKLGVTPKARIVSRAASALEPQFFGYAPVEAANRALVKAGLSWSDIGAVELNEAFAAQSLACIDAWKIDPEIVNQQGGAIAIGHPLGASGGRIVASLAKILQQTNQRYGVAAICIGVGQGLAVVIENVSVNS